jgi:hypothetical protein
MQMDDKKSRKDANNRGWKISDQKELSGDAKIIAFLKGKKPQDVTEICKKAAVNKSTFYRYRHLLLDKGLMKEVDGKYVLGDYEESSTLWNRLRQDLERAGGYLINLQVEKLELGERDQKTGWCKKIYDKKLSVQGVIVLKGAIELLAITGLHLGEYIAALLTPDNVEEDDRFKWQDKGYEVARVVRIFEGYNPSFRIAYLRDRPY